VGQILFDSFFNPTPYTHCVYLCVSDVEYIAQAFLE